MARQTATISRSGQTLSEVLDRISAAGTTVGQNVGIAQNLTDQHATATGAPTGVTAGDLIAAGYFWDGSQWVPKRAPGGVVGGGTPPHLQTRQSQRAGSNLTGGISRGGGGNTSVSGGRRSAGGAPAPAPTTSRNPLVDSVARLALEERARQLIPGSSSGIAGVGGNPLYSQSPVEASSGVPAPAPSTASATAASAQGTQGTPQGTLQITTGDRVVQQSNQDALDLLSRLIGSGGTAATKQSSRNQQQAQQNLLATLGSLAGLASGVSTSPLTGALQGIAREFRETVFPQIARSAEAGGSSKSALRSLLENDALARQQEVQSQVALEAQLRASQQQAQLASALQNLSQTDPLSQELLALLSAGARLPTNEIIPTTTATTILPV